MGTKSVRLFLTLLVVFIHSTGRAQSLYDINTIQKIEITFSQSNWDFQLDTAKAGKDDFTMAAEVKINGIAYDSVGVKYKGNSSYDSTYLKNPIHIEFDAFKNQKHQGYTDIKLSNAYGDPSMIREVLAYQILKNYMHCPLSNFAQLYINGSYIGLYSSSENIDKNFCGDHFYSSQNTFIKCNPSGNFGAATKSNFKFITSDSSQYFSRYDLKSDMGWNDLVLLCDSITNNVNSLENQIDMDRVIWMLAFNNVLINLDSYSGVFAQNHYSYKDNTGHFNPIIWDLNMAFGAFPFAGGVSATSMGNQSIIQMQQFSPSHHASDIFWPLINAVQSNATYRKKYIAHMRTILNEMFASQLYTNLASQFRSLIDTAVQSDNYKFFTYSQFQTAMDSIVDVGSYDVPGIKMLMDARTNYLLSSPDFTVTAPSISGIVINSANPTFNTSFDLKATVTNVNNNGVILAYRFDKTQKFQKASMYDDGAHNDGAANDNVFGITLNMAGGQMQYYIYAENTDAGIFSPERAEHEFYVLNASSSTPTNGQLVINEVLSDNINNERDEYGSTEDWIELYNTTNQLLDLSNTYLSDKLTFLNKWKFPPNTFITPNGYLTIWADDDSSQQIFHTNFQISKDSGLVVLSDGSQILDSVSLTAQSSNISFGRYPNGSGSFIQMNTSFAYTNNNYPLVVSNPYQVNRFIVYPNPATNEINLSFDGEKVIHIYNLQGREIYKHKGKNMMRISISSWAKGIYIIRSSDYYRKLIIE